MSFTFNIIWLPIIALLIGGVYYGLGRIGLARNERLPVMLGVLFILLGIYVAIFVAQEQLDLVGQMAELPYNATTAQTGEAILSGTIQPAELYPDEDTRINTQVQDTRLVAYEVLFWTVTGDAEDGYSGKWDSVRRIVPELTLSVNESTIRVIPPANIELRLANHEKIFYNPQKYEQASGDDDLLAVYKSAHYRGQSYTHGSLMVRGYAIGDTVTLVGTWEQENTIQPRILLRGTRDDLLADSKARAEDYRFGGIFAVVVGSAFVLFVFFQQREQRRSRAWRATASKAS